MKRRPRYGHKPESMGSNPAPGPIRRHRLLPLAWLACFPILGSVGTTVGQSTEVPQSDSGRTELPSVVATPEQRPQELPSDAWEKIVRQVRASRYDLSKEERVTAEAVEAIWVATHQELNLEFTFDAQGMRVRPRVANPWDWGLQLVGYGTKSGLQPAGRGR